MGRLRSDRRLADRVLAIDVLDNDGGTLSILPTSGAVLGLQLHGNVRAGERLLSPAGVTGIQQTTRVYAYARATRSVLVRFTPQGARCLGVAAAELASRSVALEEIVAPARARELMERVAEAATPADAVTVVERFLEAFPLAKDPAVDRALALLDSTGGDEELRVARVARALNLGERQLERRFRERVGLSPKRFASLRRFERATLLVRRAPSLTQAALAAGYYDQSHFIRDFRRFAGMAPREWMRRAMSDSYK